MSENVKISPAGRVVAVGGAAGERADVAVPLHPGAPVGGLWRNRAPEQVQKLGLLGK